jgi:plasmid stability protein
MAEILVGNLEDAILDRLKSRAQGNGRSLQAEVKIILEQAARQDTRQLSRSAYRALADDLRSRIGSGPHTDSAELLSEDRSR